MASLDTPKSRGQFVGHVKEVRNYCIIVAGTTSFSNGDGLCFLDAQGQLQGFRVNRVEGNHLYPAEMPDIRKGDTLWRNYDQQWEKLMAGKTAVRRLPLKIVLSDTEEGFELQAVMPFVGRLVSKRVQFPMPEKQLAHTDQTAGIKEVLGKLGDTIYYAKEVEIRFSQPWFIPRSMLADWRRTLIDSLIKEEYGRDEVSKAPLHDVPLRDSCFNFNISNRLSSQCLDDLAINAVEVTGNLPEGQPLMTCRYCLRYQMGWCPQRHRVKSPYQEPYYLCSKDGRRFRLEFDCKKCEMKVLHA